MKKKGYCFELIYAIVDAYKAKGKVLICGNGGLAAEAEHFAAELMGKFAFDIYIPCIALTANTSLLTALANDLGFEEVFAHQVRILGRSGDVLIAMTTSASRNIVRAIDAGNKLGLVTVCFCGPTSPEFGSKLTYKAKCEDYVSQIQQDILSQLHYLAYNSKRELREK